MRGSIRRWLLVAALAAGTIVSLLATATATAMDRMSAHSEWRLRPRVERASLRPCLVDERHLQSCRGTGRHSPVGALDF